MIAILSIVILVLFLVLYLLSEQRRVDKGLNILSKYENLTLITNSTFSDRGRLCDYYVMSSFRPYSGVRQKYDYVSLELLKAQMRLGCRFLWIDIFCDKIAAKPEPVIFNGQEKGNYNFSLNSISFENCIKEISRIAFTSGKVNNYNDPLILGLNLNVRSNMFCLNRIKEILFKNLGDKLLSIEHSVLNTNRKISEIVLKDISGSNAKIIILSNRQAENSTLEELINGYWDNSIGNYTNVVSLSNEAINKDQSAEVIKQNPNLLRDYNKTNLSIIHPSSDSIYTKQLDPQFAFDSECQFVCMNMLKIDDNMKLYLEKFNSNAFVLKDNIKYDKPALPKRNKGTGKTTDKEEKKIMCPYKSDEDYSSDSDSAWDSTIF